MKKYLRDSGPSLELGMVQPKLHASDGGPPLQRWLASHVAWVEMSSGVEAEHEVEQNSKLSPESAAWQP